ncbi:flagellar filament capping protein FliD [Paenibacillus sp. J22TS3]|uniref:flagellar filament capping protein FliD n=1 Tax=Paenibacillus sp. J22TS3 TaxID=2807192 RepID=UPI001B076EB3|nr:flagellar filament capping protein FliD [Paenibacillus sp. J22TS3]GIP21746.1 flagellar hook-associated protein 2 [Paenibacillus sp. J22TS3]
MATTPMRINGFSGMDIDSLVKNLMTARRAPLDKLNQQKTILQWTRDSYRDLNIKIVDANKKLSDFNRDSAMNTKASTVTGNTAAVKALATADASSSSMSVEVTKLATKSTLQTANGAGLTTTGATPATATLNTTLEQLATGTAADTYELNINDKTITFLKSDTIKTVQARINSSGANVTALFDEVSGKFSITAKDYGASNELKFTGDDKTVKSSTFLDLIHINTGDTANNFLKASNAEVKVTSDGATKTFTPSENKLTVNGVALTFIGTTTAGGPAAITTKADSTTAFNTIKSFVDNYNDLISTFSTKLDEAKYRDFPPLTDEQRSNMKESEITEWEKKAKSGLLKNDTILQATIASMREVITKHLGDLSSVGITTGSYSENGKLVINEDKLKAALENTPDKVLSIFRGPSGSLDSGIYSELSKQYDDTLNLFVAKAGTSKYSTDANAVYKPQSIMGDQLKDYNNRIKTLQNRLQDIESRYYKQFSAMETAMSNLQSQSSSLFGTQSK